MVLRRACGGRARSLHHCAARRRRGGSSYPFLIFIREASYAYEFAIRPVAMRPRSCSIIEIAQVHNLFVLSGPARPRWESSPLERWRLDASRATNVSAAEARAAAQALLLGARLIAGRSSANSSANSGNNAEAEPLAEQLSALRRARLEVLGMQVPSKPMAMHHKRHQHAHTTLPAVRACHRRDLHTGGRDRRRQRARRLRRPGRIRHTRAFAPRAPALAAPSPAALGGPLNPAEPAARRGRRRAPRATPSFNHRLPRGKSRVGGAI